MVDCHKLEEHRGEHRKTDYCRKGDKSFSHHYQGNIDFNTVNIHRTVGMYFLVSTGNREDIE